MKVSFIGEVYLPEMLLLLVLLIGLVQRGEASLRLPAWALVLGFLWFGSQVLTDFGRAVPASDFLRGWAKIVFVLSSCVALHMLFGDRSQRIVLFVLGLALGLVLTFYLNPSLQAQVYPWKFGYGLSVTLVLVTLACLYSQRPYFAAAILLLAAVLNLFEDFRSMAGICVVAAVYLATQQVKSNSHHSNPWRVIGLGIVFLLAGQAFISLYEYSAAEGWLGEDAQSKYEAQSGSLGILIGGRSEILVSVQAIADSPLLGHGSWVEDYQYADRLYEELRLLGYNPAPPQSGLIPAHSHLFGSWVDAGFFGALFWLGILCATVGMMFFAHSHANRISPLLSFFGFFLIWSIFFSPIGGSQRLITPFAIVLMLSAARGLPRVQEEHRGGL